MATDIDLEWGGDMVATPTGDINIVAGVDKVRQRILRRFLTTGQVLDQQGRVATLPEYIWHKDYGGNARQIVDTAMPRSTMALTIQQKLAGQARLESDVAKDPAPVINVAAIPNGVSVDAYVALADGTTVSIVGTRIKSS